MPAMCGTHIALDALADFPVKPLSEQRISQAYPLVREGSRCLSCDDWQAYASTFLKPGNDERWPAGIMVAEQPNQCIVGLFSYYVRPCLRSGRVLVIADLAAVTPFGRDIVADRLIDSIASLAGRHGAKDIEIAMAHASGWWATLFARRGYALDDRRQLVWHHSSSVAAAGSSGQPMPPSSV
jgi:hypothetical protein